MLLVRFRSFAAALFGVAAVLAGCLLTVSVASAAVPASAPKTPLDQLHAGDRVPGHYIVVFKDSVTAPGGLARGQTEYHDGKLGFVYSHAIEGYSVSGLSTADVEALRRNANVKYVTPDYVEAESEEEGPDPGEEPDPEEEEPGGEESETQVIPTGIERIFAPDNESLHIDGEDDFRVDADVAVIDSGIDRNHPDLNVVDRTNCVSSENGGVEGCVDNNGSPSSSHATHVAGTIGALDNGFGVVGVAPGVRLWSVKVFDVNGVGLTSRTIAAVNWVTAHADRIEAANMSLGCKCSHPALGEAIEASAEAGVVYAIAAGNRAEDVKNDDPAGNPDAITVSALADYDGKPGGEGSPTCKDRGPDDTLATFSNYGEEVNVAAPGVCIYSSEPGNSYGVKSGTSMATPHVAGAAALLASAENPEDLEDVEAIRQTIEEEGSTEWEDTSGDGTQEPLLDVGNEAVFAPNDAHVSTGGVGILSPTEVALSGAVNPGGLETEYRFEYGPTTEYGASVPAAGASAGSGSEYTQVEETLEGLEIGTPYHYRLVATNSEGSFYGADRVFGGATSPTADTGDAGELEPGGVILNGTVNPEGLETTYYFKYSPILFNGKLISSESIPVSPGSVGAGFSNVAVAQTITELYPGWPYAGESIYYRLIAENEAGVSYGAIELFAQPPLVTTEAAIGVGFGTATLNAKVNPNDSSTEYHFEYDTAEYKEGEEESHGISAPVPDESLSSASFGNEPVSQAIKGLEAGTTYHFRVVATNEIGTTYGKDETFTTASDPRFDLSYGKEGSGNGQLKAAKGIATDSSGNVWVADTENNRVEEFNAKGEYLAQFGKEGTGKAQFKSPKGIAIDSSGNLWVVDSGNNRVQELNAKGEWLAEFGKEGSGNGEFKSPTGIAATGSGPTVFVADTGNDRVQKFNSSGKWLATIGKSGAGDGELKAPQGVALLGSGIWVADTGNNRLQKFNSTSFKFVSKIGKEGTGNGEFKSPTAIAVDFQDKLWVIDSGNNRAEKFDKEGTYLDQFGEKGTGPGQLESPSAFALPAAQKVLVADSGNSRIESWTVKAEPPTATTSSAANVKATSANLKGMVNPEGLETTYWFEWGESESYGHKTEVKSAGSSTSATTYEEAISGLKAATTYHFRILAKGGGYTPEGKDKTFTTLKVPKATTEAASEVKTTSAKLNGTVNPEGSATSYYFEYGKTTAYGTKTSEVSAGSGTSNVAASEAISGLAEGTTYHFRVIAKGTGAGVTVEAADKELTTTTAPATAKEINVLPTLDALNRTENPLSNGGKWSALAWATNATGHPTGKDTETGWAPVDLFSAGADGAYWNPSTFSDKTGDAAALTMQSPAGENRYIALWLDMGSPGSTKSGYQLRWIGNAGGTYTVKLSKWSSGTETVLASNASVTIPTGTTMAISDTGGTVTAWQGTGGSLSSILSASDTAYSEGYAGVEGLGNLTRSTNFKAGRLLGGAITGVAVLDDFEREEVPLETGKWTETSWAEQRGGAWASPWHGYGATGYHLASAYWNPTTFSDSNSAVLVAATLGTGPVSAEVSGEYLSLWLDMPSPGSARSGYEARFTGTDGTSSGYKVELSKWVSGTRTVLASKEGFSLPVGTVMALTESGGSLALWTGTSSLSPLLSANDSTYSSGYAGIEANMGQGTAYDFRAGKVS